MHTHVYMFNYPVSRGRLRIRGDRPVYQFIMLIKSSYKDQHNYCYLLLSANFHNEIMIFLHVGCVYKDIIRGVTTERWLLLPLSYTLVLKVQCVRVESVVSDKWKIIKYLQGLMIHLHGQFAIYALTESTRAKYFRNQRAYRHKPAVKSETAHVSLWTCLNRVPISLTLEMDGND